VYDLAVVNGMLVSGQRQLAADLGVRNGHLAAIEPRGGLAGGSAEALDARGLVVVPGVIDGHVHFRSPGLEHEEDWFTGSRSAALGGVTTVLDMPNTVPPTATVEAARQKLVLASAMSVVDFGVFGLLGESERDLVELAESGHIVGLKAFLGPTTGGLRAPDDAGLSRALDVAWSARLRVAFHAEDAGTIQRGLDPPQGSGLAAHLASRPVRAEVRAINRIGEMCLGTMARVHILHVSSADGLSAIEGWRSDLVEMTAEVTPHHLLLDAKACEAFGGMAKVNPPIRARHGRRLLAALADGRIDVIGSDHAPHLESDKRRESIWDVPAGIPGVETMLPLMLTEVAAGRLSLERLVHATSERPAQIWGLWPRKGTVAVGSDADLTIVDLNREGTIRAAELHGKNNATPFEGRPTRGAVVATIVRGRVVMRDGELLASPGWGRPVSRA
jgi:dihydroorotase (multifunctional complex type)